MTREEEKDLDSLKLCEVLDIPELSLTDSRLEQAKEVWLCSYQNLVNDLKGFSHEQRAAGFFELGWRAADENPPKDTSLVKWQTGEPKERGSYIVTYRHDSKDHITSLYYVGGSWLSGDYDEVQKDKVITWCNFNDIEPYKEETMEEKKLNSNASFLDCSMVEKIELALGNTHEVVVEDGKTYVVKKKPKYPKSYEECCELLFPNSIALGKVLTSGYNCELLKKLGELLICRGAYWKMAGEQMGLGKPWEPDWKNGGQFKYCIYNCNDVIQKSTFNLISTILAFPTEEMRDAFYENFKPEIESCKELL